MVQVFNYFILIVLDKDILAYNLSGYFYLWRNGATDILESTESLQCVSGAITSQIK